MGTWGTALFSDDTARDVRDGYRDLVGDGLSSTQATDSLLREWHGSLDDPDESPVFWLALAATQWRCGRLEPRVQKRALEIIDDGSDQPRWQRDPKLLKKRQAALAELREQLASPQPPEKRIPKRYRNTCDWDIGEIISYRLRSEDLVLFRVIGFHTDKGGTSPICELLDWVGREVPSEMVLRGVGVRAERHGNCQFVLGRLRENELPSDRVRRLRVRLRPAQKPGGFLVFLWRCLDQLLEDTYGVR
jgi:hypothetical protein